MDAVGICVILFIAIAGIADAIGAARKRRINNLRRQWGFRKGSMEWSDPEWHLDKPMRGEK